MSESKEEIIARMHMNAAATMGAPVVGAKIPQVDAQIDDMWKTIEMLEMSINKLDARLGKVLLPIGPTPMPDTQKDLQLVPLATEMRNQAMKTKDLVRRIIAITESIEI